MSSPLSWLLYHELPTTSVPHPPLLSLWPNVLLSRRIHFLLCANLPPSAKYLVWEQPCCWQISEMQTSPSQFTSYVTFLRISLLGGRKPGQRLKTRSIFVPIQLVLIQCDPFLAWILILSSSSPPPLLPQVCCSFFFPFSLILAYFLTSLCLPMSAGSMLVHPVVGLFS